MDTSTQLATALGGRYEIEREIGAGGMATVYLARDVRHDRHVALKVLRPELGAVLGAERFLSEIRVTANLQHPNLLPLFDSGEANGLLYYVMPFVQGESLRARVEREKQLPVDDAIRIITLIAGAVDYAHRHGVIHRDLKPENILLHDGQPVVADFGIALAVSNSGGARITQTGLSLGTPQYMSPEQAAGDRAIDARTDIYALGAIAYELLCGEPPHTGSTAQAIIAKLIMDEPRPLSQLRRSVPPQVEAAVLRALEKLPADRYASAQEFSNALNANAATVPVTRFAAPSRRSSPLVAISATVAVAASALAAWGWSRHPAERSAVPARFEVTMPTGTSVDNIYAPIAMAPDGRTIVFRALTDNVVRLMRRRIDDLAPRALPGTERGGWPAVSGDSKWVAYASGNEIRKTPIDGGPVMRVKHVARTDGGDGLAWVGADAIIVGGGDGGGGLTIVPANGGAERILTVPDTAAGEMKHTWPHVLEDGKTVLFVTWPSEGMSGARIAITDINGARPIITDVVGTRPLTYRDHHLIYVSVDGALMAVPFDMSRGKTTGAPVTLIEGISTNRIVGNARVDIANNGTLLYLTGNYAAQLVSVDASGTAEMLLDESKGLITSPRWSPDGRRIALSIETPQGYDIWTRDVVTKALTRVTSDGRSRTPAWSPDGRSLIYVSTDARGTVWRKTLDDASPAEQLVRFPNAVINEAVVSITNQLIVRTASEGRLYIVDLNGTNRTPTRLTSSTFTEVQPAFSPDGKWLAYVTDEGTSPQIIVRPFPASTPTLQVTANGGTEPVWSPDGKTLYYHEGKKIIAVSLSLGAKPVVTATRQLFEGPYLAPALNGPHTYSISPDGKRFTMLRYSTDAARLIVVANWFDELRAKIGVK